MKRVVADTNIVVSALQFGGKPKQLIDLATDSQVDLAISEAIIAETLRVLRDKFQRSPEWLLEADRQLRVIARLVEPTESLHVVVADPTDDRILECARRLERQILALTVGEVDRENDRCGGIESSITEDHLENRLEVFAT